MSKHPPTEEAFNKLLAWLNPNREEAAEIYNRIQTRLIKIFSAHGCADPEDLTNQTFDIVLLKIDWLKENYVGEPILYFCAVARNLVKEDYRNRTTARVVPTANPSVGPVDEDTESDLLYQCLDQCMEKFSKQGQRLLVSYYEEKGNEKIINRRKLAAELGITLTALRLRVFHMRGQLKLCIEICLKNSAVHETL